MDNINYKMDFCASEKCKIKESCARHYKNYKDFGAGKLVHFLDMDRDSCNLFIKIGGENNK